jgi:hypothetical protein
MAKRRLHTPFKCSSSWEALRFDETSAKMQRTRIGKRFTTDFTDDTDGFQSGLFSSVPSVKSVVPPLHRIRGIPQRSLDICKRVYRKSETSAKIPITRMKKKFTTDFTDGTDDVQRKMHSSVPSVVAPLSHPLNFAEVSVCGAVGF